MVLGAAVTTAACDSSAGDGQASTQQPSSASPTPTPAMSSADPEAAEKAAVLAAYARMWEEQTKAYKKADAAGTELEKYATLDALGQFRNDLARMRQAGTVARGELTHSSTKVTSIDLKAKTPEASLSDCMDISKWQTYSMKKKQVLPLPSNQPLRYVATAKAERWNGQWLVTVFTTHGNEKC
ncbi:hypothetical protein [Streptomyces sp. NPDC014006]|uniref:hypothetical protein n=1 Tax=Streptomyces sp. NPDC014006 TaxID=3364870 RepID=UPI0037009280